MAGWLIKYYEALMPLDKLMKDRVYRSAYLNLDETTVTVLNVKDKNGKVSRNSFVYLAIGSEYDNTRRDVHALVHCEYHQGRKVDDIMENLKKYKYSGYILTDGLEAYYHYPHPDRHGCCWVHAVRGFKNVLKVNSKDKVAKEICEHAAQLYRIDDELRVKLYAGEIDGDSFLKERKERSMVEIDTVLSLVNENRSKYTPGSQMGKAFRYIDEYSLYLTPYLECVEGTPSNNNVERLAKAFATGRKNWLFSNCVDGADASLIESAKLQGLSPADYLEYVFTFGPGCKTSAQWEQMLPWNADLSRLEPLRLARMRACSNLNRREPYIFAGAVI